MEQEKRTYKIIAATGLAPLNSSIDALPDCNVLCTVDIKSELPTRIETYNPDIVIVSDVLSGDESLIKMLTHLKRVHQFTRFIYLAGDVSPRDKERINSLGTLVLMGIYDIVMAQKITIDIVNDVIHFPKSEASVSFLTSRLLDDKSEIQAAIGSGIVYENVEMPTNAEDAINNIYVFTSVKPGTGKSFVSVNAACAIAKYGKDNPRVALVEADLQTLSIGTLLAIDDDKKKNMRTAMEAISTIIDKGNIVGDSDAIYKVNRIIRNCMVPYSKINNLDVLVGSNLTPEEVESMKITPEYYIYLLDELAKEYDIVIVDTNSSLFHVTSFPILQKARTCFYILNLDINNIRNNLRYQNTLKNLRITHKIKWILNEDVQNTKEFKDAGVSMETLFFTSEMLEKDYFTLSAKIPLVPKTVFLNRLYDGTPVVLDNNVTYTNKAKLALMNVANIIYPMGAEYDKLKNRIEKSGGGFLSSLFGGGNKKVEKKAKKKKGKKENDVADTDSSDSL